MATSQEACQKPWPFLPPVNCPDLHYPRSRISMAFLAHLQTFTWRTWILDRERHDKGIRLDSTQQSRPPMRPKDHGAVRTRVCCLVGRGTSGHHQKTGHCQRVAEARCRGELYCAVCCWLCRQWTPKETSRRSYCCTTTYYGTAAALQQTSPSVDQQSESGAPQEQSARAVAAIVQL